MPQVFQRGYPAAEPIDQACRLVNRTAQSRRKFSASAALGKRHEQAFDRDRLRDEILLDHAGNERL
jgi:hypothetical protein